MHIRRACGQVDPALQPPRADIGLSCFARTSIALAIHAAELYQFSSVPGLLLRRIARDSSDNERLFAAPTASAWQGILRNMSTAGGNTISRENPRAELDIFHIHALLGQVLIDIHNSREMQQGCLLLRSQYETPTQFYELMIGLSNECGISPRDNVSRPTDNRYTTFRALWHYCYVDFWSSSGDIEAAVGRYGTNIIARQALGRLRTWVNTPPARLAALHAICVLEEAAGLSDVNFLIPRLVSATLQEQSFEADVVPLSILLYSAIYRSTLLLFCILSLADSQLSEPGRSVKINGAVDWLSLADLCSKLNSSNAHSAVVGHAQTSTNGLERYIISGGAIIARPFLSGHDRHTDIVR